MEHHFKSERIQSSFFLFIVWLLSIMADYDLIAFVLVNQILEMNDADEEDWAELLKYNVLAIFPPENWALLPMRGQLALASTIVGAKSLVNYDIAFRIMCAWEEVGGCYWVAQLELMRHAVMHTIRSHLSGPDQVNFDATELKDRIFSLLPVEPAKHVTHHILRLKLALLRADLLWLLDSMSASANPYEEFVHYYDQYKLHCFVPWFLSWSLNLLKTTEDCFPLLGQGATAMLHGQAQKFTGKTHIQECKQCEDDEEEEEMSDISVSHIDIEECADGVFEAVEREEKEHNVVPEGVGVTPGGIPRIHLKRKYGDLSRTTVSPSPTQDSVNKPQRTRNVPGRTLFATPPPMENYLYTSAPTTIVTHDEPTPGTESVYEGVDYSDCMQIDEAAEDEANKENRPHFGDEACSFKKAHTVSTTPNRLPCQDLRIVTDAMELHALTMRANNAHPTTIPNTTTTTTAKATTTNHKRPHTAAFDDDIVHSYTHFTNATTPRETSTGPHYPLTSHTTCSSPNSTYSNTNSNNNSTTSDDTYVTSMTVDGPDSMLNHLVQSVWKIFTPVSQNNTITTTAPTTKQVRSMRVNRVASSASLEYSVTTAHTTV